MASTAMGSTLKLCGALCIITYACCGLAAEAAANAGGRRLGRPGPPGRHLLQGGSSVYAASDERQLLELSMAELTGAYEGLNDQWSVPVWNYFFDGIFPNCSSDDAFTYSHWIVGDPHYTIVYAMPSEGASATTYGSANVGHFATYTQDFESYNPQTALFNYTYEYEGVKYTECMHWKPYVNMRTGDVEILSLSKARITQVPGKDPVYASATCEITGEEQPGCYDDSPDDITTASVPDATTIPEGTRQVTSISAATWLCRNGECARHAPKLAKVVQEQLE